MLKGSFEDGVEVPGLLEELHLSSLIDCTMACKRTKDCKGFNWIESQCQLLGGGPVIAGQRSGAISGILPCA